MDLHRKTFAEVSTENLRENIKVLKSMACSQNFFCPMVKASAYGHGDIEVAKILEEEGVEFVGVALVEEAIRLREAGLNKLNILVFGNFHRESVKAFVDHKITPVLSHWEQLKFLEEEVPREIAVHIKFNVGMFRQGFPINEAEVLAETLKQQSKIKVAGVCTHLSQAEDALEENSVTSSELTKFEEALSFFPEDKYVHALNSAGMLASAIKEGMQKYGARPGIALYGYLPDLKNLSDKGLKGLQNFKVKSVMSMKSEIIQFHSLEKGESVSYGGLWTADKKSVVAVVPIGYADGYHRSMRGQAKMLFRGQEVPVVGTICMDYVMIEVTDSARSKALKVGEEVVIFNEKMTAESLANWAETIPYEILTSMSQRVPRIYL